MMRQSVRDEQRTYTEPSVYNNRSSSSKMWAFALVVHSVYFVASARATCPQVCECLGNIVNCAGKELLRIPKGLPVDVTNLDLSKNRLSTVDNNGFLKYSKLIELNLSDNELNSVESLGQLPKSLQRLRLRGNKLTKLTGHWSRFEKLDFSNNLIESINNDTFSNSRILDEINLSSNRVRVIGAGVFKNLYNLKTLRLDRNNLTQLPDLKLLSLITLDLSNNKLETIYPIKLSKMTPSLQRLILSHNSIKSVKLAAFSGLDDLKELRLDHNFLENIDKGLTFGLKSLEDLSLENNEIKSISSETWRAQCCQNLKSINLAHNKLGTVNGNFSALDSLEFLDMTNNPIEEVTKDAFGTLVELGDLRMSSHMLLCSCKLQWFSKWLKKSRFSRSVALKCKSPERLLGDDFSKIPAGDLCDSLPYELIEHPKNHTALRGNNVQLSCTVGNGSVAAIQIMWQKDMKNITEAVSTTQTQVQNKYEYRRSILYLYNVTAQKDNGEYQCLVVTKNGRFPSRIAKLRVLIPPKFTRKPRDIVAHRGDDIRFNCSASGDPQPEIFFRKVKEPHMPAIDKRRIDLIGRTVVIRNVSREDVGLYRCFAKSEAGIKNTTFAVNILGKPIPIHQMLDKIILVNDAAIFVCAASGWPAPSYRWFKDDEPVNLADSDIHVRQDVNAQNLIILHARYSHAGLYKCVVSNNLGYFELTSRLKVVKELPESPTKSDRPNDSNKTLVAAVVFTAVCTMAITTIVCIAIYHVVIRRGSGGFCRRTFIETVILDSLATNGDVKNREYVQMRENFANESPHSSSTFVTSCDSQSPSDCNYLQTSSSESGSTKGHRDSSYDGRHSLVVCSMNSSTSSLASSVDVSSSRCPRGHHISGQLKYNEQHRARRKHKSSRDKPSRSRDRNVNKRRKMHEQERLHSEPRSETATDEYRTEEDATVL